jgi:hypothetical protein
VKRILLLGLLALGGCSSLVQNRIEHFATGQIASDFNTYSVRRVGLLPVIGRSMDQEHAELLQSAFFVELSKETNFDIVPLTERDLEEIDHTESYVRGAYEPEMVIALARRFRFDGMFVGTVVDYQFYTPQKISVELELVATETGAAIWTSEVHLDSSVPRVRKSLEAFYQEGGAGETESGDGWRLALISPRLFAQFAAWQVAQLL